jgi:hypothetical protein
MNLQADFVQDYNLTYINLWTPFATRLSMRLAEILTGLASARDCKMIKAHCGGIYLHRHLVRSRSRNIFQKATIVGSA